MAHLIVDFRSGISKFFGNYLMLPGVTFFLIVSPNRINMNFYREIKKKSSRSEMRCRIAY